MATAKDINALRKAGQLDEAFCLASELLEAEPDNIWNKRAMGWVRYERLKSVAKAESTEPFIEEWTAINVLVADNPAEEALLTNNVTWQAVSRLFSLPDGSDANGLLNLIFASVQEWVLEQPSELYSALLKAVLKTGKNWAGLKNFLAWWQLTNLRPEDYLPTIFADGRKGMALAEQAYIAYAKQLLLHPETEAVKTLIAQLEIVAEEHPEYQYPSYYQAKLLTVVGTKEDALAALLPFARKKQREFWMWDLLAELFHDEPEKAIACLCRAVTCPTQEKFLVNARVVLARRLNKAGFKNEALTELTLSLKARQAEGWGVMINVEEAKQKKIQAETGIQLLKVSLVDTIEKMEQKGAIALSDNKALYQRYLPLTDDLLYADFPEQVGVVINVNAEKKIAHFMVSKEVTGHFKFEKRMARVQPGNFVALRLEKRTGKDGEYWVPLSVKFTKQKPSGEVFKEFNGSLRRVAGKDFGFVEDVFIPLYLFKMVSLEDKAKVSGAALLAFDKGKQVYGWKALTINQGDRVLSH
ncbi:hypothetical protein GCM10023187_09400 [Nibrella viscosa]|uniref:Tetratricopeptide repeat protein n=1 Tax=Nibrella viscosa TaxID=1084524 RepID=A0ABP8JZN8_9BACT